GACGNGGERGQRSRGGIDFENGNVVGLEIRYEEEESRGAYFDGERTVSPWGVRPDRSEKSGGWIDSEYGDVVAERIRNVREVSRRIDGNRRGPRRIWNRIANGR